MLDQLLLLEPLFRLMPMPPSLVRHAPLSATRKIKTYRLSDTPLAAGLAATFDDSCKLSIASDMELSQVPVKLIAHGVKRQYQGIHVTVLSARGNIALVLGDNHCKVFIGSDTSVNANIQLFRRPTVFIGDHTAIGQSRLIVNSADLVIGEDCHLIEDILVQCNEAHPMVDVQNSAVIGPERQRTYLGRHVLVNRRVTLLPGVRIGDGAIVQAGAVVASDVQPNSLVGGVPATTLKELVTWQRERDVRPG